MVEAPLSVVLRHGFLNIKDLETFFRPSTLRKGSRAKYVYNVKELSGVISARCNSKVQRASYDVDFKHSDVRSLAPKCVKFGFLYGPVDEEETLSRTQRIYVSDSLGQREQCHLLIFRAYSSTVCLLVNVSHELTVAFLKSHEGYLSTEFVALANEISKQCTKLSSLSPLDGQSNYIYFNRMNLAQKSTVHSERRTGIVDPPELVRFLADINEDLKQIEDAGEMTAKTTTEWWVVGKVSDKREFYVVLNQKSTNIIQIHGAPYFLLSLFLILRHLHFTDYFFIKGEVTFNRKAEPSQELHEANHNKRDPSQEPQETARHKRCRWDTSIGNLPKVLQDAKQKRAEPFERKMFLLERLVVAVEAKATQAE
ncbi:hypothetical protein HPB49_003400 [Dermacentor silvarum]|uniref:Uncharacterized protein n=1 Tax=Dermacentor silvarum TaxID=543639 RepID=A0ACB8CP88_DERSI|nr:hypothetical protein HPB49_003400 [Dermacentor silvarum]